MSVWSLQASTGNLYRFKLINFKSSEKNRIQNSLTVSNIMISIVVSDTFGVSSMKIINHILENPDDKDFDVLPMLHLSMEDKAETITRSINGNLTKPQADKMRVCLGHFDNIEKHIKDIETAVLDLIKPFIDQIEIILSLPSIKDIFTAIAIIGEIGNDMSAFHFVKNEPFNYDLYEIDSKPKQTYASHITEESAIRFLQTLGYQIPDMCNKT